MTFKRLNLRFCIVTLLLLASHAAFAHPGHGVGGLLHGFFHPLQGADHLLTAFAVGLWAAQAKGKSIYALPGAFVGSMVLGGILGFMGYALPFVEAGVVASLGLLGLALLFSLKLPLKLSVFAVAAFGVLHGNAHGLEMTPGLSSALFCTGFVLSTALIHLLGVSSVLILNRCFESRLSIAIVRTSGAMASLCSIFMGSQIL